MLKAIETVYKGYRFRSRLEARWAVFFDTLGIKWEYEKEGYHLAAVPTDKAWMTKDEIRPLYYLPDFWLPEQETWFEVKSGKPSPEEETKARRLAYWSGHDVIIAKGEIPASEDDVAGDAFDKFEKYFGGSGGWDCPHVPTVCPDCKWFGFEYPEGDRAGCDCRKSRASYDWDERLEWAYTKARQARFEHGETPDNPRIPETPHQHGWRRTLPMPDMKPREWVITKDELAHAAQTSPWAEFDRIRKKYYEQQGKTPPTE